MSTLLAHVLVEPKPTVNAVSILSGTSEFVLCRGKRERETSLCVRARELYRPTLKVR